MENTPVGSRIRIAICGGGIAGLCLAISLSAHPHLVVDLYEATGQFKEIGAGVMIWSRTWRILELMGLANEFSKIAHAPPTGTQAIGFDFRRSDQDHEGFRFKSVEMPYGCIRFHRAEFLDVFVNHIPEGVAHFGKRLISYSQISAESPIHLSFADGSATTCDVLVGADGIKSSVRAQLYSAAAKIQEDPSLLRYIYPVWTGTIAYRGLIRVQDIPRGNDGSIHRTVVAPMMYCGKNKHVVSYSISQGDIVNVVTFSSELEKHGQLYSGEWVTECEQKELLDCYRGWEPEVEQLLKCIKKPSRWAIHHLRPLPFYYKDNIVLIGDAVCVLAFHIQPKFPTHIMKAHAMSPHQGAGAGQAIEDAFILSGLLAKVTPDSLSRALEAYQAVRMPAANTVLKGSYDSGMMYEFNGDDGVEYGKLGEAIQRQWKWIDETSVEEDLAIAVELASRK